MEYISQTPEEIKLYVISGQCDIEQFLILKKSSLVNSDVKFTFGILGASHFATIESTTSTITEICACTSGAFLKSNTIHIDEYLTNIRPNVYRTETDDFIHTLSWEVTDEKVGAAIWNEQLGHRQVTANHLSYIFPGKNSTDNAAKTELLATIVDNKASIHSLHTYPNVQQMVFTTSEFIIK